MFIELADIKEIEIELSTYCNAACPGCSRHWWGTSDKLPNLIEEHLSIETVSAIISQLPDPSKVDIQLCGNIGDPMMHPKVLDGLKTWINDYNIRGVYIDTNGGLRGESFWKELAQIPKVYCTFSIDGLEDTNHIYRVNVNWKKLERNFTTFIENGGLAEWKFLIFEHNQHQIKQARDTARLYGFNRFIPKMSMREPLDNAITDLQKKKITLTTERAKDIRKKNISNIKDSENISCKALDIQRIYLNGEGRIWPCCYTSQRYMKSQPFYPTKFEDESPYLFEWYRKGFNVAKDHSLKDILNHEVWTNFKNEWNNKTKCKYKVCWDTCKSRAWEMNNHINQEDNSFHNPGWRP